MLRKNCAILRSKGRIGQKRGTSVGSTPTRKVPKLIFNRSGQDCSIISDDGKPAYQGIIDRDYIPHVRRRGEEIEAKKTVPGYRARRWVVEVCNSVIKTDGWQGYSFLDASPGLHHDWLVPGSGKEAPKVLPWVHTLIANMKGNIRGIHHGVSPKHLPRYLAEFCYRFNRRFWEPQMFNRMLHACLNSATITFSELRA
jgi:hypothetical protein